MPDVRRRDLGDAMGQVVAGIAGGLANGGSTAITQIRDITSTGREQSSQTVAAGGYVRRLEGTAPGIYDPAQITAEQLEDGLWLLQGRAQLSWASGQSGSVRARLTNSAGVEISDWYVGAPGESSLVIIQAHAWSFASVGVWLAWEGQDMTAAATDGSASIEAFLIGATI